HWSAILTSLILTLPSTASAAQLTDGTVIHVRLVNAINSERSTTGDEVRFVVTRDVLAAGEVLIRKGTAVAGTVVKARRASWGWVEHDARLAFRFSHTVTTTGELIRLRASLDPRAKDRVVVDRNRRHHDLQWAGEADTFDAYVDGNYEL